MTPSYLSFNQPVDVESNEITTVDLLSLIKRPGIDSLIDYLGDSDSYSKYITCTKCSGPVDNYEPGSFRYQEHYGHPLPAICESCLNIIFRRCP